MDLLPEDVERPTGPRAAGEDVVPGIHRPGRVREFHPRDVQVPEGLGRVGKEEIGKFCAAYIRPDAIRFEVRQTLNGGPTCCVNVGTIYTKGPDGRVGWNEVINVYEVNDRGEITLLRSYWDFDANQQTFF